MILALAGGVGGARLAQGLVRILSPRELTLVVNVGDDFEHLGLTICPDIDTVMYTLAGMQNPSTGWGRADETWHFMDALGRIGGETWFRLGDRDLAVHVERTRRLAAGATLSDVTAALCAAFGVAHPVVPATDQRLRTRVLTDTGELAFQDYFVRRRAEPAIRALRFDGADAARPAPALAALIETGRISGIVVCPSNPWLSVDPILAVEPIAALVDSHTVPVVAVSPIVAGRAVKGPAAKIMRELGAGDDVLGVVDHYATRVGAWVIDRQDAALGDAIRSRGCRVAVTDTIMSTTGRSCELAATALAMLDVSGAS